MSAHDAAEPRSPWERVAFVAGILAALLHITFLAIFIGAIAPGMPPMDASAAQAVAFYAEQSRNPTYLIVSYLFQAQILFLLLFFGGLFAAMRRAEQGSSALAAAVFGAGIAIAVISPLVEMIEHHLLLGLAAAGGDAVIVRGFDGMAPVSFALCGFPQAIVLGGASALMFSGRLGPRWLGWAGVVLAALSLVSTSTLITPSMVFIGMLVALLFKLWILALSIALLGQARRARQLAPRGVLA
jgi:hypothetical protein